VIRLTDSKLTELIIKVFPNYPFKTSKNLVDVFCLKA
jgi:hypothetical protein